MTSPNAIPLITPARGIPVRVLMRYAAPVWLAFGFAQAVQSYVYAVAVGRPFNLSDSLLMGMPWWFSWMALTPGIAWLAGRYPFTSGRAARSLFAHLAWAAVISTAHLLLVSSVFWFTVGVDTGPATSLANQMQRFFGAYFLESILTYGATAGAIVAIEFARAARDETVARTTLEAEAAALEASVTRARLDALAMELNPHFLFNTLGAIASLVSQNRPAEARAVLERLSALLRRTLGLGNEQLSSVESELQMLDDYLYIQRVRFSDRLRVTLDVDATARECAIPPMLLQPLVENAIRHGIEPREAGGDVHVSVGRVGGSVRISIGDSGAGFALDGEGRLAHEGIGISNTRARLEHLFGGNATLVLKNAPAGGAEAVVVLPARKAPGVVS